MPFSKINGLLHFKQEISLILFNTQVSQFCTGFFVVIKVAKL